MAYVGTSLNAVTSGQIGSIVSFDQPRAVIMQINVSGTPTGNCTLEGSSDGINFYSLGSTGVGVGSLLASTTQVMFARANLTSFSGGTLTALIGGK